jgi:hypothetical protein
VPDVEVRRPLLLLIEGKDVEPKARHPLEYPAEVSGNVLVLVLVLQNVPGSL